MQDILNQLNKTQGVQGSLVVNKDGIVVASEFGIDADETEIGAVASSILSALEGAIKHVKIGKLKRYVVTGSDCKIVIVQTDPALLLVLVDREVNLGMINVEIQSAMAELVEKAKI